MLTNYTHHQLMSVIHAMRSFFSHRSFQELISPVLSPTIPLEPNIYPFTTQWHIGQTPKTFFLSTSPERSLKCALAQGIGNCFSIGHCFRNLEGSGPQHSPEFLMLEWYRKDATYVDIMNDVQDLIIWISAHTNTQTTDVSFAWPQMSLEDLFLTYLHISISDILTDSSLITYAEKKGYTTHDTTWSELFDQLVLNEIMPHLPLSPYFLTDFPSRISPLCTPKPSAPHLAQRCELFIQGVEIGNGNTEYTDTTHIESVFSKESIQRTRLHLEAPPIDTEFLSSLDSLKGTSYAGMGLGVERLTCLLYGIPLSM